MMDFTSVNPGASLAAGILDQMDELLREAEEQTRPVEMDPFRSRVFELFVTAEAAGFLDDDAPEDLSAEGLCRALAERWGLRDAAVTSVEQNQQLPTEHLAKMRLLWSVMRMWMEWTYAWQRWDEFHMPAG